ncbi:MAG: hypothetical protein FWB80_08550, partial [Defluviitaleaceae bacterium]|nr:hypothetical protein [Defluviitaleaceae bacterium]
MSNKNNSLLAIAIILATIIGVIVVAFAVFIVLGALNTPPTAPTNITEQEVVQNRPTATAPQQNVSTETQAEPPTGQQVPYVNALREEWLTLSEIQGQRGYYIKRGDRFLRLDNSYSRYTRQLQGAFTTTHTLGLTNTLIANTLSKPPLQLLPGDQVIYVGTNLTQPDMRTLHPHLPDGYYMATNLWAMADGLYVFWDGIGVWPNTFYTNINGEILLIDGIWRDRITVFTHINGQPLTNNGTTTHFNLISYNPGELTEIWRTQYVLMGERDQQFILTGLRGTIIMKDMTRWGRNYLQVGQAMEHFRIHDVRFVAINNSIDSLNPDSLEIAPFINIMSEWYAKDIS